MQAVSNAVNAANAWKAHVPFQLSDSPESKNYSMIDMFSMVNLTRHAKELYFPYECKTLRRIIEEIIKKRPAKSIPNE